MNLQERIEILSQLGQYLGGRLTSEENLRLETIIQHAYIKNPWFTPENIRRAASAIADNFLQPTMLKQWTEAYHIENHSTPKKVGIVMAGNIPMVGFHDLLCTFISGHISICKLSSKDDVLLRHVVEFMSGLQPEVNQYILFADRLNDCDAYIATGSNNSARYFIHYFGKYPSIIRNNRTSIAILTGNESGSELERLADDIMLYFGLGCRNVTQIHVPRDYDFTPLLNALKKYSNYFNHHKYKNNFDYQLTIYLMNKIPYLTNDSIILTENQQPFSPIGTLHYAYYDQEDAVYEQFKQHSEIQTIVGRKGLAFGITQKPALTDYADGVDVMKFLKTL
jgi:hypothetical protein